MTLNSLFTNEAVLQQEMKVPVWRTAEDGEIVTVEFAGQKVSTTVGKCGVRYCSIGSSAGLGGVGILIYNPSLS